MSLSDIAAVRLKSSDKSSLTREEGIGDGESVYFKLSHAPVLSLPDVEIRKNNTIMLTGYTVDHDNGIVTFAVPPVGQTALVDADKLEFVFYWSIFSDAEVQYFIDAAGGNLTIATAYLLLAIAADASKVAQRQSLAGGGGLGAVTLDTSVTARELRATAQALVTMEAEISGTVPAEGLTEPAWTESGFREGWEQGVIRRSGL